MATHSTMQVSQYPSTPNKPHGVYRPMLDPTAQATYQTLRVLPQAERAYTEYDIALLAEILTLAELRSLEAFRASRGTGQVTLQRLLKAYEVVLPQHGVKAEDDIYYYRFLLKLSLDPDLDWWAKFRREAQHGTSVLGSPPRMRHASPRPSPPISPTHMRPAAHQTQSAAQPLSDRPRSHPGASPRGAVSGIPSGPVNVNAPPSGHPGRTLRVSGPNPPSGTSSGHVSGYSGRLGSVHANDQDLPGGPQGGQASVYSGDYVTLPGPPLQQPTYAPPASPSQADFQPDIVPSFEPQQGGLQFDAPRQRMGQTHPGAVQFATLHQAQQQPQVSRQYAGPYQAQGQAQPQSATQYGMPHQSQPQGPTQYGGPPQAQTQPERATRYGAPYQTQTQPQDGSPDKVSHQEQTQPEGAIQYGSPHHIQAYPQGAEIAGASHQTQPHWQAPVVPSADSYGPGGPVATGYALPTHVLQPYTAWQVSPQHITPQGPAAHRRLSAQEGMPGQGQGQRGTGSHASKSGRANSWHDLGTSQHNEPMLDEEEAMAYADFRCLAGSFRNWRANAAVARDTKEARDAAVENWLIAVSFWEVHLARRCLTQWAAYRGEVLARALKFWTGATVTECFNGWRKVSKAQRVFGVLSREHSTKRLRAKALRVWRQHVVFSKTKAVGVMKALSYWKGHNTRTCWQAWRLHTKQSVVHGQDADSYYATHARRVLMLMWHRAAQRLHRDRVVMAAITGQVEARIRFAALSTWHARWATRKRNTALLASCGARLRNQCVGSAWNKWLDFVEQCKAERGVMAKAGQFFLHGSLAKSWNRWQEAVQEGKALRSAASRALWFWSNRMLASGWNSWQQLVAWRKENEVVARQHAHRSLAYLQLEAWQGWRTWHLRRSAKAEIIGRYMQQLQAGTQARALAVWRDAVLRRRLDMQAFNEIMKLEVLRLKGGAWKKLQLAWRRAQKATHVTGRLRCALAVRVLRHWRVLSRFKRQRRQNRVAVVHEIVAARRLRILSAWQLAAATCAEHRRMVADARVRSQRVTARRALRALRGEVLATARERATELAACLHWGESKRQSALRAWRSRTRHWRHKRAKWEQAGVHRRHRLMDRAFFAFVSQWHVYQDKVGRALMHLTGNRCLVASCVLRDWRLVTIASSAKHSLVRRALAHWMAGTMGRCFDTWLDWACQRASLKTRLAAAMMHWYRGNMARAFNRWKDWALHKVELWGKAKAYLSVLAGRATAYSMLMLQANAARKRSSHEARALYAHMLKRRAVQAWRQRRLMSLMLQSRLMGVFNQMLGATKRQAFDAWWHYIHLARSNQGAAFKALMYWMGHRQRIAFNTLRWYTVRKQMERQLILRYNLTFMLGVLREWRGATAHQRSLRLRYSHVLGRTQQQIKTEALTSWRQWVERKKSSKMSTVKAIRYMLHHGMVGAFNAWWGAVLGKRELLIRAGKIVLRMQNRDLAQALDAFQAHVVQRGIKRMADRHYRACTLAKVFGMWRLSLKISLAVELWSGNSIRSSWDRWSSLCHECRRLRITSNTVARRWCNLQLSAAWQQWHDHTLQTRDIKSRLALVLGHWANRRLAAAWRGWGSFTQWRSNMRLVAAHVIKRIRGRELLGGWNAWLELMYLAQAKRTAIRRWVLRNMSAAFNTWRDLALNKAVAKRTAEDLFRLIVNRLATDVFSSTFYAWHKYATKMARLKIILKRILGEILEVAFYGWSEVAREKRQRKEWGTKIQASVAQHPLLELTAHKALNRWTAWPLSVAFTTWRQKTAEHKTKLEAAAMAVFAYTGGMLRKAFVGWRLSASTQRSSQNKAARALFSMGAFKLGRYFCWWAALAPYLSHMRRSIMSLQRRGAARVLASLWAAWRYRVEYARIARKVMASLVFKTQLFTLRRWHETARVQGERKRKVQQALGRMLNRALAGAFMTWLQRTQQSKNLQTKASQVVRRLMNRALATAWTSWVEFVHDRHAVQGKVERALKFWTNAQLAAAWNKWMAFHEGRVAKTRADVHYWGRLLDGAWIAWRNLVEDAAAMRILEANRLSIFQQAMDHWQAWTAESRRRSQLQEGLTQLALLRRIRTWRLMTLARKALRRLFQRRALTGWYNRVLFLQQERTKLRLAVQVLLFGSLARMFRCWFQYTQEQNFKRTVFSQKQAAIKEAVRIGDEIRIRRNLDLLGAVLRAWRFQVGVYRKVAKRFASVMQRGVATAFREWRDWVLVIRVANNRALNHFRRVYLERYLTAWRATAAALRTHVVEMTELAEDHWYGRCVGRALHGWTTQVNLGRARRQALLRVLQTMVAAERKELLWQVLGAWCEWMATHTSLLGMAHMASQSRRMRIKGDVFNVWLQYARAMQEDVNLDSPFASPRTDKDNRRLVRRTAYMMGSTEVDAGSDKSSELFGDIFQSDRVVAGLARQATREVYSGLSGSRDSDDGSEEGSEEGRDRVAFHAPAAPHFTVYSTPTVLAVRQGRPQPAMMGQGVAVFAGARARGSLSGPTPGYPLGPTPVPFRLATTPAGTSELAGVEPARVQGSSILERAMRGNPMAGRLSVQMPVRELRGGMEPGGRDSSSGSSFSST